MRLLRFHSGELTLMQPQPHLLLVVEDHIMTLNILRGLFVHKGWRVATACTVEQGLFHLDNGNPPDWVFLDLMLPDGPGERVLKHIRDRKLKTRVIVMTGAYDPPRMEQLATLEPDAVVQKPINLDQVFRLCESPARK